ncbi:hypothetical protein Y032_0370g112 [Ancylostoma ceylanicum]|uniref:Uncharacterized protein n=1 Tax=Ancylostoma ceylanicum TaxID=53326 RepID=A0A016RUI9_9BILA|nr:hypothetical protein Y032_0370g112 [Ancylostoma ceylanicum]
MTTLLQSQGVDVSGNGDGQVDSTGLHEGFPCQTQRLLEDKLDQSGKLCKNVLPIAVDKLRDRSAAFLGRDTGALHTGSGVSA